MGDILKYIGLLLLLVLLQLFLFNNIQLSGYINPYIYILFILLLPYSTPGWLLLVSGFFLGLIIDTFMNTYGMHSSATLFLAFARPYVLNLLADREDVDQKGRPSLSSNGMGWFVKYTLVAVFTHHLFLFFVESFTFANFFATILRVILSTLVTSFFIVIAQFLSLRK
ncbi:MAG: rod shape-determining protein MreD [Bacteroidales bacterium]